MCGPFSYSLLFIWKFHEVNPGQYFVLILSIIFMCFTTILLIYGSVMQRLTPKQVKFNVCYIFIVCCTRYKENSCHLHEMRYIHSKF